MLTVMPTLFSIFWTLAAKKRPGRCGKVSVAVPKKWCGPGGRFFRTGAVCQPKSLSVFDERRGVSVDGPVLPGLSALLMA
jgi:hypothetical protein